MIDRSVFSFPLFLFPFIPFNSPLIFTLISSPSVTPSLQTQFLFYSVFCQVAELKYELKLRSLPVSGTKNDLLERLRTYLELNGGSDTTSSLAAGGTTGPGAEGAGEPSMTAATTTNNTLQQQFQFQCHQASLTAHSGEQKIYLLFFQCAFTPYLNYVFKCWTITKKTV